MADYLMMLNKEQWIEVGSTFDYIKATDNFVGLKLFPMVKTDNMKLAVATLVEGGELPVMAMVHALDAEAHIGDRPNIEEFKYEVLTIKEKLNQGERLRKKIKDLGVTAEDTLIREVYNDIYNLIMRVLTRLEVMACELLSTGKIVVNENNINVTIDFNIPTDHLITAAGWSTANHDIIGDLDQLQILAKGKIRRAITTTKVIGYMLKNTGIKALWANKIERLSRRNLLAWLLEDFGIEFVVYDGTYKTSAQDSTEYAFIKANTIAFVTTDGEVGKTYLTTTPEEDDLGASADITENMMVTVTQWKAPDPVAVWTKATALGLPVIADNKSLWIVTVS